jgi:hypothetical protein
MTLKIKIRRMREWRKKFGKASTKTITSYEWLRELWQKFFFLFHHRK